MAVDVRKQAGVVRRYLEALQRHKPKRGLKRTPDSIRKRIAKIDSQLKDAPALQSLQLVQEKLDLQQELDRLKTKSDLGKVEAEFVKVAKSYSEHKGISYTAWREAGVSAEVLRKAGIPRTRRGGASS
jgi:hypothetical protein